MGCNAYLTTTEPHHRCLFYDKGFIWKDFQYQGCRTAYHADCIAVGPPFRTRLNIGTRGTQYPPVMAMCSFVCEACTVRVHLGRELTSSPSDNALLMLERMRMIDAAHSRAPSTLIKTRQGISRLKRFEKLFGFQFLPTLSIKTPPWSPSIPIFWAIEHYTLQSSSRDPSGTIPFNTARGLRSAAAAFFSWELALFYPSQVHRDRDRRVLHPSGVSPTDDLMSSFTASGFSRRLGTESRPSVALLHRHILWNQEFRHDQFRHMSDPAGRYICAAAAVVELISFLGWLRGSEVFSLNWEDIQVFPPRQSARFGLPEGAGVVLLRLRPSTKSDPTKTADVVIAYRTQGNLELGVWLSRLRSEAKTFGWTTGPVFRHEHGRRWDSRYFLRHISSRCSRSNRLLETHYFGFLMDLQAILSRRRSIRCTPIVAAVVPMCPVNDQVFPELAHKGEILEHARWRTRHTGCEDMPLHYQEWTVEDRLYITYLSM
ncbi:MAG: hypothetical protein ACREBR_02970 [bacterium]